MRLLSWIEDTLWFYKHCLFCSPKKVCCFVQRPALEWAGITWAAPLTWFVTCFSPPSCQSPSLTGLLPPRWPLRFPQPAPLFPARGFIPTPLSDWSPVIPFGGTSLDMVPEKLPHLQPSHSTALSFDFLHSTDHYMNDAVYLYLVFVFFFC